MIDFRYLPIGLHGMANAHRANALAGHLGAAVIAGFFFGEDHPDLAPEVVAALQQQLDRISAGDESIWFDQKKAGISIPELFEPLADEAPNEAAIPDIAVTLAADIGTLRQSGHDVIFATIALRALHDHPDQATPAVVNGIQRLIAGFHKQTSGRGYYGKARGWLQGEKVELSDDADFPPYADEQQMVETLVTEMVDSAGIRRQGFGDMFHLINHAAALTELARFGYRGLARQGLAAHHHHLRLWRSLPDVEDELGSLVKTDLDPRTPAYWATIGDSEQWSANLTHRIKTMYGFHTILRLIENDAKRRQAEQAFGYLMA